jgi:hypothetical protein
MDIMGSTQKVRNDRAQTFQLLSIRSKKTALETIGFSKSVGGTLCQASTLIIVAAMLAIINSWRHDAH